MEGLSLHWLMPLVVLAQTVVAQDSTPSQSSAPGGADPNTLYNGGDDNPPDPSDAGAAGTSKGAFNLSKGGLAAIIVVCSLVAVLGGKHPDESSKRPS